MACIGLALAWPARRNGLIAAAILAPFMLFAHPTRFLVVSRHRRLPSPLAHVSRLVESFYFPLVRSCILVAARWYVAHHHGYEVEWRETPFWQLNGADQFHVFGERYAWFTIAIALFCSARHRPRLLCESSSRAKFWNDRRLILELYFISFVGYRVTSRKSAHSTPPEAGSVPWLRA